VLKVPATYASLQTAKQNGLVPFKYQLVVFERTLFVLALTPEDWEQFLPYGVFTLDKMVRIISIYI